MISELLGPDLAEQKALIAIMAKEEGPIVIEGEGGTGKTLYARRLHASMGGGETGLPVVNLATVSEREGRLALLGSDFEKLTSTRRSFLEHPGLVLIQHINAAPPGLQDTLARAFLERRFVRPGSILYTRVACRPVFTLRRSAGEFHRTGSITGGLCQLLASARAVHIPPLRERPGDISAIARDALGRDLTSELEVNLLARPWPGNVTQLKVYLICIRPFTGRGGHPDRCLLEVTKVLHHIEEGKQLSMKETLLRIEGMLVARALRRTEGHRTRAAQLLGITRATLQWHLERYRGNS